MYCFLVVLVYDIHSYLILDIDLCIDDHSRVILDMVDEETDSDYINADYVDVSHGNSYLVILTCQLSQP